MADLTFTHASEYVIAVDGDAVTETEDDANPPTGIAISFAGLIIPAMAVVLTRKK